MSTITLAAPIQIPSPPSRTPTPRPATSSSPETLENAIFDDEVSTPQMRPRSDTMSSASSSGSSPFLQTPETPSILGVLSGNVDAKGRVRQDSYGFSLSFSPPPIPPESDSGARRESTVFEMDDSPPPPTARRSFEHPSDPHSWPSPPPPLPVPTYAPLAVPPGEEPDLAEQNPDTLRSRVRRRLERSRTSLRSLAHRDEPTTDTDEDVLPSKKGRLRSFIAKLPRSNSAASLLSLSSSSPGLPPSEHPATPSAVPLAATPGVTVRDFGYADYFAPLPGRSITADELAGPLLIKPKKTSGKGKARALSPKRLIKRPSLLSMPSSLPLPTPLSPISAVSDLESPVSGPPKSDLFAAMLPRELQIQIFSTLASITSERGRGKWEGRAGGLKELIRISRVSKEWQALALDGQLWPLVHLAPFASVMHPSTLSRIINSSRPFIKSLSLRGMDNLAGTELISALAERQSIYLDCTLSYSLRLPSLTHLDLRGCKALDSHHIAALIMQSPRLRVVNLKGVQGVSSEVIRTIARYSSLTHLDVSRCWDLTLGDMTIYIAMLSDAQAAALRSLRIAGIKSYGHNAAELFPLIAKRLVNLELLDFQGCTHIFTSDIQRLAGIWEEDGRTSSLRHLILSGCTSLTSEALGCLVKRLPDLEYLEMAAMPDLFRDFDSRSTDFEKLLKSMPRLRKLDLEGTGIHGGVTDRLLDTLTPSKYGDADQVGREMEELRIGYAKNVTPDAMIRLIRGCSKLRVLEVDNTSANNAVMREFLRRRGHPDASLSLIDCRAITPASYGSLAPVSRARRGWTGYASVPFGYDHSDSTLAGAGGELVQKPVLKTFWSWRRVGVPPGWREALAADADVEVVDDVREAEGELRRPSTMSRRGSGWWRGTVDDDDRAGCIIM